MGWYVADVQSQNMLALYIQATLLVKDLQLLVHKREFFNDLEHRYIARLLYFCCCRRFAKMAFIDCVET